MARLARCAIACWLIAFATLAHAADGLDGQRYVPAAGAAGGFVIERPLVLHHLGFGAGLFLHFADDAVVVRQEPGGREVAVPLSTALTADLLLSLGLGDIFELALVLPVDLVYQGDRVFSATQTLAASAGIGDVRLVPKVLIWENGTPSMHWAIGFAAPVSLPTGDPAALRGDPSVTVEPKVLFAVGGERWDVTTNVGARLRSTTVVAGTKIGSELTYGAALTLGLVPDTLDLSAELFGSVMPSAHPDRSEAPLELLAGLIIKATPQWSFYVGGGLGLTDGIGSPDFRAIGGVRYASGLPDRHRFEDPDHDGINNEHDRCPNEAEDFDGFQDEDGCPDPDNDQDGVPDDRDECPDDAAPGVPDGCPRGRVMVREGKVHLFGKILFNTGSTVVHRRSEPLLDDIAIALKDHPELARIRVEGHTDNVGDAAMNVRLSQDRAESVKKALVARGIPASRLEVRGYGESHPIAPNTAPAGRARNRRVEFVILKE
jgi:outer membrane protein OmpA-like peptidoglycan-associated protein